MRGIVHGGGVCVIDDLEGVVGTRRERGGGGPGEGTAVVEAAWCVLVCLFVLKGTEPDGRKVGEAYWQW